MMKYFHLLRINHWIKNTFLFLPLFFGLKLNDIDLLIHSFIGFISFSLFASASYIINDYFDIERDRVHPDKSKRPLASGTISKKSSFIILGVILIIAVVLALRLPIQFLYIAIFYFFINILYSIKLKHFSIIDILIIAAGFILRIYAGGVIAGIVPSIWLTLMTFLLALFIALAKRRDDVLIYLDKGQKMRKVVEGYNIEFLNVAMSIMASVIIVAYIMYAISGEVMERLHTDKLYYSVVFVISGILRYLQLVLIEKDSGSPTELLYRDRTLQFTLLGWIVSIGLILYVL